MWVEAVAITATFGFQADGKPQQETIAKSNKHVGVVCEEKLLGRSEVF